jgi:hypothetical protein
MTKEACPEQFPQWPCSNPSAHLALAPQQVLAPKWNFGGPNFSKHSKLKHQS